MPLHARELIRATKRRAVVYVAGHTDRPFVRAGVRAAAAIVRAAENDNGDPTTNGEAAVLHRLRGCAVATVFDVGAHKGEWAQRALDCFPHASLHCFELSPVIFRDLQRRLGSRPNVTVNSFGLADEPGRVVAATPDRHPEMTSVVDRPGADPESTTFFEVELETGDRYMRRHGVDSIDLLKVDAEGADLRVLQGFREALESGRVGAVQFEFTLWAAIARTWLADFYELLEPLGYRLGKVFPNRVDWREYRPEHEVFVRTNYLAVHRSRADLLAALGAPR